MPTMSRSRKTIPRLTALPRVALAALLAAGSWGCGKKDSGTTPPGYSDDGGGARGGTLEDYERALADEERRLHSAGVALGGRVSGAGAGADASKEEIGGVDMTQAPAPTEAAEVRSPSQDRTPRRERNRCAEVCGISTSICDLRVQICGLAERHPDEPRYHQVCERASGDCESAREACDACG